MIYHNNMKHRRICTGFCFGTARVTVITTTLSRQFESVKKSRIRLTTPFLRPYYPYEGARQITRSRDLYNRDASIAVGYRGHLTRAAQYRIWAANILKEYIIKRRAMDDERLKQSYVNGNTWFILYL
jgi:hypothetical protein